MRLAVHALLLASAAAFAPAPLPRAGNLGCGPRRSLHVRQGVLRRIYDRWLAPDFEAPDDADEDGDIDGLLGLAEEFAEDTAADLQERVEAMVADRSVLGQRKAGPLSRRQKSLLERITKEKDDASPELSMLGIPELDATGDEGDAAIVEEFRGQSSSLLRRLLQALRPIGRDEKLEWTEYPTHPSFPDYDLGPKMPKTFAGDPPLNQVWSLHKLSRALLRAASFLVTLRGVFRRKFNTNGRPFYAYFNPSSETVQPFEPALEHWYEDGEFARQFLQGVNPLMIERVSSFDEQVPAFVREKDEAAALKALAAEGELFMVDYTDLEKLKLKELDQPIVTSYRCFYAPVIFFRKTADPQATCSLTVAAIMLERDAGKPLYTAETTGAEDPLRWIFAKMAVQCADAQIHEWQSHLGRTHLVIDPIMIAEYNTLRRATLEGGGEHPIHTYLSGVFKETLFLNWAARKTLVAYDPEDKPDDIKTYGTADISASSVGVGQALQLVSFNWLRFDFLTSGLPDDLQRRGFDADGAADGVGDYYFRDDGMALWNALESFARDVVDGWYKDDAAVAADSALQEFALECAQEDRGRVPGFPRTFEDKETLVKSLTIISWTASGLHAAVNFPQFAYYGYVPNRPLFFRTKMPAPEDRVTLTTLFDDAVARFRNAIQGMLITWTLTLPSEHNLDERDKDFKGRGRQAYLREAYDRFKVRLEGIEAAIDARNLDLADQDKVPYTYLEPENVPTSIDI